ncbi:MAG TPA: 3-hydroxyacyl-CoA dehydrogenase NAD-binding domain-containing protein [Chloroflexota bacterium]|nr:3-hydroxyacyl-CoA dehydrogenase NAD-binding domain-containing protein [Chloroflexota bacterium]
MAGSIERLGIVGTGTMGAGIAQVAVQAGIDVWLVDAAPGAVELAVDRIGRGLARAVERGTLTDDARGAALGRLHPAPDVEALAGAQFVVEAVIEREAAKVEVIAALDRVLGADAVLASNTSSISITRLAAATGRPDRVVGMHFFNPVPAMRLVELVRGVHSSEAAIGTARDLALRLGKTPVEVRDYPGFVSNRLLMPMINEAAYALLEGVATAEAIDQVMTLGMNHPMGPLALADLIGLDVCLDIMRVLQSGFGDDKYRPCPLLVNLVAAGYLGRKSGRGFFTYERRP